MAIFHFVNLDTDEPLGNLRKPNSRAACLAARELWGPRLALIDRNEGGESTLYEVLWPKEKPGRIGNLGYGFLSAWDEDNHCRIIRKRNTT